jgi:hypothetical protein
LPWSAAAATFWSAYWENYDTRAEAEALAACDQAMIATGICHDRRVAVPGCDGEMEDEVYGDSFH